MSGNSMTETELTCSFCYRPSREVRKIIQGPGVNICDTCVNDSHDALLDNFVVPEAVKPIVAPSTLTPRKIKNYLDNHVIGQESAKIAISVALAAHQSRIRTPIIDGIKIEKSNLLLIGPSASGKTLMVRLAAENMGIPFIVADATTFTESGYVGEDVESMVSRLLVAADGDVEKAKTGIIFIDEIDKLRTGHSMSGVRDPGGEGVQQALLKMIEGCEMHVPPIGVRRNNSSAMTKIDTNSILFICAGAFTGIEDIIDAENNTGMGFGSIKIGNSREPNVLRRVKPEHFIKFGMIPELIGRLPVIAVLDALTESDLVRVLVEPQNAILSQMAAQFKIEGVMLEFTADALVQVARAAAERKTGARGLRGVIEEHLNRLRYELPEMSGAGISRIVIDENVFKNDAEPQIFRNPDVDGTQITM